MKAWLRNRHCVKATRVVFVDVRHDQRPARLLLPEWLVGTGEKPKIGLSALTRVVGVPTAGERRAGVYPTYAEYVKRRAGLQIRVLRQVSVQQRACHLCSGRCGSLR